MQDLHKDLYFKYDFKWLETLQLTKAKSVLFRKKMLQRGTKLAKQIN